MNQDEFLARLKGVEWYDFEYKRAKRGVPEDAFKMKPKLLRFKAVHGQGRDQVGTKLGPSWDQVGPQSRTTPRVGADVR